ncbi:MAG TPA: hypothetical protein VIG33_07650 [Pseudobdellovibrionaceae bacterium]|jgi:hypothetical protein
MFAKGMKKVEGSGRKPGTPNKKSLLRVEEVLAEKNVNPTEEILAIIPSLDPNEQVRAWGMLLSYIQPKPASGGVGKSDSSDDTNILTIEDVLEMTAHIPNEFLIEMAKKKDHEEKA